MRPFLSASVTPLTTRRLQSWVTSFLDYTKGMGVPPLWRKWAAITTVSGALGRRVLLRTARGQLHPNVYVLLVSSPGIGKSLIIEQVGEFWTQVDGLNVAPSSTTRAGLIDQFLASKRIETSSGLPEISHSILCASVEFGNLVPTYDNQWLNFLNELYDNPKVYSDRTRKLGELRIEHPHIVIVAGTQPKYLDNLLPEAAFGMGFTSRFIMAYVGEGIHTKMFSKVGRSESLRSYLIDDLKQIAQLQGEYFLTPEAEDLFEQLYEARFPPIPSHSKLQHYATRRTAHILKLIMCFAAAESPSFRIQPRHIEAAVGLLLETEKDLPQIFQEMSSKGFADANEEVWQYAMQVWLTNGRKPVSESKMQSFLFGKIPTVHIRQTLETMVTAGFFEIKMLSSGGVPYKGYIPLEKNPR